MNKIKEIFNKDSSSADSPSSNTRSSGVVGGDHSSRGGEDFNERVGGPGAGRDTMMKGGGAQAGHQSRHLGHQDSSEATHDHKHLASVTKESVHQHETEEVRRQRDLDRHVHHVQHHVQPVVDEKSRHSTTQNIVAPTEIHEQHVNTGSDTKAFQGLNVHQNEVRHSGEKTRNVVDKGEVVNESETHHVHHVVQPVIERDIHDHKTIQTVIPVKHVTHEAPIVHQSTTHEPMKLDDFVAGGGDLQSKTLHEHAGILASGHYGREVRGPGEKIMDKLHIGNPGSHTAHTGSGSHGIGGEGVGREQHGLGSGGGAMGGQSNTMGGGAGAGAGTGARGDDRMGDSSRIGSAR